MLVTDVAERLASALDVLSASGEVTVGVEEVARELAEELLKLVLELELTELELELELEETLDADDWDEDVCVEVGVAVVCV